MVSKGGAPMGQRILQLLLGLAGLALMIVCVVKVFMGFHDWNTYVSIVMGLAIIMLAIASPPKSRS
jgi:hypothetical protein